MPSPIRIMVVDDSVVARRMIGDILRNEKNFEVVATAANGRIALAKVPIVKPAVITLDVDMPEMNGMEMLAWLRENHPEIRVLMVSSLTRKGAQTTVDALFLGASDYVTKTSGAASPEQACTIMKNQLVPKINALMALPMCDPAPRPRPKPAPPKKSPRSKRVDPRIVAIGSSTGGPNALVTVLKDVPADFPVPIVIVQHMPEDFTDHLANRLNSKCRVTVTHAVDGAALKPGHALIAPGNRHLEVVAGHPEITVKLHDGPLVNSCRPSVDVLFRSVAEVYGAAALGVVLTGMGQDGLVGSREMAGAGARIFAQDKDSSVVWGMPGYVAQAGLADKILPVGDLGIEIALAVKKRRR